MKMKVAMLQTKVYADKNRNLEQVRALMAREDVSSCDLVTLPEMWNCPYQTENFPVYAEHQDSDYVRALAELARKHRVYFQAGSIAEIDDEGRIYNTAYTFDREGKLIGKHRKVHLFDIYAHGQQVFKESDTLSAGDTFEVFDTEFGKMAVNICFDIRFPESSRIPALKGARIIMNPGAFNMTTGPAHWEIGFRQRAIENQVFMIGTAPSRDLEAGYIAWGHSIITDPWGKVIVQLDEGEGVAIAELNLNEIDRIRAKLPLMSARRTDLYSLEEIR